MHGTAAQQQVSTLLFMVCHVIQGCGGRYKMRPRVPSATPREQGKRVRAGFLLLSGSAGELCSDLIQFNSTLGLGTRSPGALENGAVASLAFSFFLKKESSP